LGLKPEIDKSELCDEKKHRNYQKLAGIAQWLITCGRLDLSFAFRHCHGFPMHRAKNTSILRYMCLSSSSTDTQGSGSALISQVISHLVPLKNQIRLWTSLSKIYKVAKIGPPKFHLCCDYVGNDDGTWSKRTLTGANNILKRKKSLVQSFRNRSARHFPQLCTLTITGRTMKQMQSASLVTHLYHG
jgi:hypothetical protein